VPRRKKISFDTVREIGLALPAVEEGTSYGKPALKVRGKMFVCIPSHRTAEPDSLAVRIDFDRRDELLAGDPQVYYLPDHYIDYATILVRLSRVHPDALRELIYMAHRFMSAGQKRTAKTK
jgi:hypothetical protein